MTTLYETLTAAVNVLPEEGEGEQAFLSRLKRAVDKLGEPEFKALPEEAQLWANDAYTAVQQSQPIQMLPGAPFTQPEAGTETEQETGAAETATRPTGGKKGAKAAKAADAKKGGKGAAAKPAEAKKPAKDAKKAKTPAAAKEPKAAAAKPGGRKPRGENDEPGVLEYLTRAMHAKPASSVKELVEAARSLGYKGEIKEANAIGIRQQYRRFARFFNSVGAFKKNIELD